MSLLHLEQSSSAADAGDVEPELGVGELPPSNLDRPSGLDLLDHTVRGRSSSLPARMPLTLLLQRRWRLKPRTLDILTDRRSRRRRPPGARALKLGSG